MRKTNQNNKKRNGIIMAIALIMALMIGGVLYGVTTNTDKPENDKQVVQEQGNKEEDEGEKPSKPEGESGNGKDDKKDLTEKEKDKNEEEEEEQPDSDKSDKPDKTGEKDENKKPSKPSNSNGLNNDNGLNDSGQPNQPNQPNKPEQPNHPDRPDEPNKPEKPEEPEEPEKPDRPDEPSKPVNVTVSIKDRSSAYGETLKSLDFDIVSGNVTKAKLSKYISLTKEAGTDPGKYQITGKCTNTSKYNVKFSREGTYTISKASIGIKIKNVTITYGDSLPNLDQYEITSGKVIGNDILGFKGTVVGYNRKAGTYTITGSISNEKYIASIDTATCTVNKQHIKIEAQDVKSYVGEEIKNIPGGIKSGKLASWDKQENVFRFITTADKNVVGDYSITIENLDPNNYTVELSNTATYKVRNSALNPDDPSEPPEPDKPTPIVPPEDPGTDSLEDMITPTDPSDEPETIISDTDSPKEPEDSPENSILVGPDIGNPTE